MNFQNLTGDAYVIYFEEGELIGLREYEDFFIHLKQQFPGKTFIGMVKGVTMEELTDEKVDELIDILQNIKNNRAES